MKIAILDDYQDAALTLADWSRLSNLAEIAVFTDTIADPEALTGRLAPFDILCVMRERTPLPRAILERLPRLRLIASTGARNASIDLEAAAELGIEVRNTGYFASPTVELTWALILARVRNIVDEAISMRVGGWQRSVGFGLKGKTLGLLGLGNVGSEVARIGQAFGMKVIAWSENLTSEKAGEVGVERVEKHDLFARSDILTIHLVLSRRTRGLVDARMFALMRPEAYLINTSRGPIVDERALVKALDDKRIAGAAVDVFDVEPLPAGHIFRRQPGLLATPHIGYVTAELYRTFYGDAVRLIENFLAELPPDLHAQVR
ncbi:D-2-hydroxyacid dehydrogenase family protein [Bosea sp. TAB14]|uniref:D-2-hydroxyacid dehydrogenase family protein n=1 Tax=Bosea sp. TAB14 TaxID=3237481 RepID=UPI003F93BC83